MKVNWKKYGFAVFLFSLMVFIHLQGQLRFIKDGKLFGDVKRQSQPKFIFETFLDGGYQLKFADYVKDNVPFFRSCIRTYNQIDFSLFKEVHAKNVVVGKENFLYEEDYITAFNGEFLLEDSIFLRREEKIRALQKVFRQHNTKLLMVFAPSKAHYYQEYLPGDMAYAEPAEESNYNRYKHLMKKLSVPTIDVNAFFLKAKEGSNYPLMTQTGIHWSQYGMGLAIDSIISFCEKSYGWQLPKLERNGLTVSTKPHGTDDDIEKGMNLIQKLNTQKLAYPNYSFDSTKKYDKKKVLLIGDSFGLGLYRLGLTNDCFSNGEFWFYCKERYDTDSKKKVKTSYLNWVKTITESDLIILLSTAPTLRKFPWRFFDYSYHHFYPESTETKEREKYLQKYIEAIKNSEEWTNRLRKKAEKDNGADLETVMRMEARYLYEKNQLGRFD